MKNKKTNPNVHLAAVAVSDRAIGSGAVGRPVLRAFEQVAQHICKLIDNGSLPGNARLPNEAHLAREFGVGRGTVREALRMLSAQNLVRTERGRDGGTFINLPTVEELSETLRSHYTLLSRDVISVEDFYEVRMMMEVPAARLAATRASPTQIELLRSIVPDEPLSSLSANHRRNTEFHSVLLEGCGNHLLCLAAQPVLHVLRRSIAHEYITQEFRQQIKQQHQIIAEAISDRDADAAGREMEMHLKFLRPAYDLIGHHTHTPTDGAQGTGYLGRSDL